MTLWLRLVFALKWNTLKDNVLLSRSIHEGCMIVQTGAKNVILSFPILCRVIPFHRTLTT